MNMKWIAALVLAVASIACAKVQTEEVVYEVAGRQHRGVIAYDDATPGKAPGVLVFPEWWGANDYVKTRARMLAELGYVAFVADMYGEGKTTDKPQEAGTLAKAVYGDAKVLVERADGALRALKRSGKAEESRIAAIGYCFGGNVALNLAWSGADIKAVVAFHSNLTNRLKDQSRPIKAKVLVCDGAEDKMVSDEERKAFVEEMKSSGADWQYIVYGKAMHSFTNPNSDKHKELGTIGYNADADQRSWRLMKDHLAEALEHRKPAAAEQGKAAR